MNTQPLVLFMPDYAAITLNGEYIIRIRKNHNPLIVRVKFNTGCNL